MKYLLSRILRLLFGSRSISVSPNSEYHRILLVRQHNQLGDMLCVIPLLRALRARYPTAYIALVASPVNYDVVKACSFVNEVLNFDKKAGVRSFAGFVRELRGREFELAIVASTVSTSFTSDLFAGLSKASLRIGAASLDGRENPSSFFFNAPRALDWRSTPHRHQTLRNLDIARELGISTGDLSLELTFSESERQLADQLQRAKLEQQKMVICYHPGAGKVPNRWDATRFAKVAHNLAQEFNASTIITCGPMDDQPVAEMIRSVDVPYNLIKAKPIREVSVILSTADLVITNDTGIMHVAAAVGVPVLSLFGPTDPEQWAPIGRSHRWIRGRDGDINNLSADEVLKTAREMLEARRRSIGSTWHARG